MRLIWLEIAALMLLQGLALAEPASSQVRSNAMIETIAARGTECGYLKTWEGAALKAMAHQDRNSWSTEALGALRLEAARQLSETDCDTDFLTVWIEAARRGFDYEMLLPYLVAYQTLAQMESPPLVFTANTLRLNKTDVLQAIEVKLSDLSASGQLPEGGKPWPEYTRRTADAVLEFADTLDGEGGDQAAAWIAQSALITELWYKDGAP